MTNLRRAGISLFVMGGLMPGLANGQGAPFSLRPLAWHLAAAKGGGIPPAGVDSETFKKLQRFAWTNHHVQPSDNIWKLAVRYGTTAESLQSSNAAELIWMKPGSTLLVINRRGTLHRVRTKNGRGEMLSEIARLYKPRDSEAARRLQEDIVAANKLPGHALVSSFELPPDSLLLIPNTYLEFDTFRMPFKYVTPRISSSFGMRFHPILKRQRFHDGLDFAQPHNTPVYASRSGRVLFADWKSGYGLTVEIQHSDRTTSRYGHMSKIYVKEGQWIEAGKKMIGRVGSTGISTGPHLHFEIRDSKGRPINPRKKLGRK